VEGADSRFRFAQFEFPRELGPDDGRYLVRAPGAERPAHVLVLATLGARERRLMTRRRARRADPEPPPSPVPTARATVIDSEVVDERRAARWLEGLGPDGQAQALAERLAVLNRALHLHRLSAADPGVSDATLDGALVARLGYGSGDQVAEGRWSAAVEVPVRDGRGRRRRSAALRPQERLAALLAGRDRPLACEELTLRARLDLDAGRLREAALQVRVALEAGLAELADDTAEAAERLGELREQRGAIGAAANAALAGDLGDEPARAVAHAVGRLEAALRARSARGGFGA
jgi:hypothetical protein